MIPAVLDIEASGFGRGSYPIEVGYVLPDGRSKCFLIKPLDAWQMWDSEAEKLHGISRALLHMRGNDIVTVAETLNRELGGMTVYSDAWGNDQSWLALLFDCAERVQGFRLQALSVLLDDAQRKAWAETRRAVAGELALGRHRASNDARILQQTWLRLQSAVDSAAQQRGRALLRF